MFENDKNAQLYEMIQQVFSMLDSEELPQTAGALSNLLAGNADGLPEPLAIANGIMDLDKPKTFPDYVIDFITELCEMEIGAGNADAIAENIPWKTKIITPKIQ